MYQEKDFGVQRPIGMDWWQLHDSNNALFTIDDWSSPAQLTDPVFDLVSLEWMKTLGALNCIFSGKTIELGLSTLSRMRRLFVTRTY
jgi:hypothetical protein